MPQPAQVADTADELIALWREAHAALLAELAEAMQDDRLWRRRARLRELIASHAEMIDTLTTGTRTWLASSLPQIHALGAISAAPTFAWTQTHREAVQALATKTWDDVAAHLQGIDTDGRRAIRTLTRTATREIIAEGRTAANTGRRLERWAAERGIGTVTYSNGRRVTIGDYADTLARTVAAEVYNGGTFTQLGDDGIEWVEVFDGPACGWTSHQDPDKANGTIRRLDDAMANSLSHPRCARSFGGRPDVTSATQAAKARRFTPEEQARMAAEEDARAAAAPVTLSGRTRASRQPRTTRAR